MSSPPVDAVAAYRHVERDLFAEPETYFYARCDGADFLDRWRAARSRFRETLDEAARAESSHAVSVAIGPTGGRALRDLLIEVHDALEQGAIDADAGFRRLRPFVMKFEVFKRLFSHYRADLRRHPRARPAALEDYALLASCLARIATDSPRLQCLSTLLKLNDALSSQPVERFTAAGSEATLRALDLEEQIIARLADDGGTC